MANILKIHKNNKLQEIFVAHGSAKYLLMSMPRRQSGG